MWVRVCEKVRVYLHVCICTWMHVVCLSACVYVHVCTEGSTTCVGVYEGYAVGQCVQELSEQAIGPLPPLTSCWI